MRENKHCIALLFLCSAILFLSGKPAASADPAERVEGYSSDEAVRLGMRIYREGILPSGEPVTAFVQGDIPVNGRMFTCVSCHLRSGIGSIEGTVITPPTNSAYLFKPLPRGVGWRAPGYSGPDNPAWKKPPPSFDGGFVRPAYTEETLAAAIAIGINPDGLPLNPAMPVYSLSDRDMALLIAYLRVLSAEFSPGLTEKELRFATVVGESVDKSDRDAMLAVLQSFIDARNSQTRSEERRARGGPFFRADKYASYRRLALDRWELKGPPESWRGQLEAYYREEPVFALLGGIVNGEWRPVHEFCEENRIPSLFPVSDKPVVSDNDWYTLYFSKGYSQEGEAVARYIRSAEGLPLEPRIVQVYRREGSGELVARGFDQMWKKSSRPAAGAVVLGPGDSVDAGMLRDIVGSQRPDVMLLWLDSKDLGAMEGLTEPLNKVGTIFLSSSMLGEDHLTLVPDAIRKKVYLTHPYSIPVDKAKNVSILKRWLKTRNIPEADLRIQGKMYFLGWMLSGLLMDMRNDFYRDYFFDAMDMMIDQDYAVSMYPRLSFGPGQRYASKGCYIVQLTEGSEPELIVKGGWVIQ